MSRYFTRAHRAFYADDDVRVESMKPAIEVCDHEARFTGLLDARGEEIWEAPRAIGFGRRGEW